MFEWCMARFGRLGSLFTQHKNLSPYKFVVDSSQMLSTRVIRDLCRMESKE